MDGTLLRGENICACIARKIGKSAEQDAFELLRSREEISKGRAEMAEWYAPYDSETLLGYLEELCFAPGVEAAFNRLREEGIRIALVSITWQFAVEWLATRLGADYAVGTGWTQGKPIDHFWPEDKASWLQSLLTTLQMDRNALFAVGDSYGDVPMLKLARSGYFVGASVPEKIEHVYHWPDADISVIVDHMLA